MQALMIRFGWTPMAFDIKMAYINADIPEDEQVPIQFEKSLRRYDKNGNELFTLLQKCLYGSPTATRRYTQMRDEWMLQHFNSEWRPQLFPGAPVSRGESKREAVNQLRARAEHRRAPLRVAEARPPCARQAVQRRCF